MPSVSILYHKCIITLSFIIHCSFPYLTHHIGPLVSSVVKCLECGAQVCTSNHLSLVAPLQLHHTVTVCHDTRAVGLCRGKGLAGMCVDVVHLESYTGSARTSTSNVETQRKVTFKFYSACHCLWYKVGRRNTLEKTNVFVLCCDQFNLLCLLAQMLIMYSLTRCSCSAPELLLFISWKSSLFSTSLFLQNHFVKNVSFPLEMFILRCSK